MRTNWLSELITKFDEIQSNILIKYCSFIHQVSRLCFSRTEISPSHLSAIWTSCECRHRWSPDTAPSRLLHDLAHNSAAEKTKAVNHRWQPIASTGQHIRRHLLACIDTPSGRSRRVIDSLDVTKLLISSTNRSTIVAGVLFQQLNDEASATWTKFVPYWIHDSHSRQWL